MKTIFVESQQFNEMMSYKPYTKNKEEQKKVKYALLDSIQDAIGDKWYRLKDGTRQTFDMICFFSTELGFFYASDKYLSKRHKISERTVQYRLKELLELGQVVKIHKRARKCNGRGKPIYLFVNHPYFEYWVDFLGLNTLNCDADCETENDEIPSGSKDEKEKINPTFIIHKKQESNNYISNPTPNKIIQYVVNRVNDSMKKGTKIKYLSSYIDKIVTKLEWQALYAENNRQIAAKQKAHNALYENVKDMLAKPVPKVAFYNWLES